MSFFSLSLFLIADRLFYDVRVLDGVGQGDHEERVLFHLTPNRLLCVGVAAPRPENNNDLSTMHRSIVEMGADSTVFALLYKYAIHAIALRRGRENGR
jgi:hypothetical protein